MKKGDLRKQEILQTAELLFCRYGYEHTSIQDILDRLNISKGSFYHHYVSKESLLEGICRKRAEQIYSTVSVHIRPEQDPSANLNSLLSGMIPFKDEKLSFLLMLLPVFRTPEGKAVRMSYCDELLKQFKPAVIQELEKGNQAGILACQFPDITADMILSLINRMWVTICDSIIDTEEKGKETDISSCLHLTECYRKMIERMILLPYGSISLIEIPTLDSLAEQIHNHWTK